MSISCSQIWRLNVVDIKIIPKLTHIFSVISNKNSDKLSIEKNDISFIILM